MILVATHINMISTHIIVIACNHVSILKNQHANLILTIINIKAQTKLIYYRKKTYNKYLDPTQNSKYTYITVIVIM